VCLGPDAHVAAQGSLRHSSSIHHLDVQYFHNPGQVSQQKFAIVRPLLKKVNIDPSDLNSYRPISNLSYVSKLLERIIDSRLTEHANTNNLFSPLQSAYRKHYSTETALVKIHNDLISHIDQGHVGALVLLDLSSAFDTVDHHIFLKILQHRFTVTDSALNWFSSSLSGRSQTIHINKSISDIVNIGCGVPQFSGSKNIHFVHGRH